MYYSNGNYEAFAHPEKPEGIEKKRAVVIGAGLAGLSAACFLVRDAQMPGENITIMEDMPVAGGACDGILNIDKGFIIRGGREMENHFECLWDLFRSIPSIENPEVSVLDEYYWLNKHDPNYSLCRATVKRGEEAHTDKKFKLDRDSALALSRLFMTPEKDLEDKIEALRADKDKIIQEKDLLDQRNDKLRVEVNLIQRQSDETQARIEELTAQEKEQYELFCKQVRQEE